MPGEVEGVPGLKQARDAFDVAYHGNGKSWQDALALALVIAEPEIRTQERQRVRDARRDVEGVPFLDAARALCPDEAHWEDGGWERYAADASACLDAFLAALDSLERDDGE